MNKVIQNHVIDEVKAERQRQHDKWGDQRHSYYKWLSILMEEVGECSKALLHIEEGTPDIDFREEMVQVATVAVQIIENIDGGQDKIPENKVL